jgi:hypothetical protein
VNDTGDLREDLPMELGISVQRAARAYDQIGARHQWRKGRNSSRGYDMLTVPNDAWGDEPHDRYLALVHHHLSTGAALLSAGGQPGESTNGPAVLWLASGVFVASSKASWLLEDGCTLLQRAARAHLELYANLDREMRRLPKRLESGYPDPRRKHLKECRDQLRAEVLVPLFGKRSLAGKLDDLTLADEALVTSTQLQEQFHLAVCRNGIAPFKSAFVAAPDLLVDSSQPVELNLDLPLAVDEGVAEHGLLVALDAWLAALRSWTSYNGWDTNLVDEITAEVHALRQP